jgi:hypothetical protein
LLFFGTVPLGAADYTLLTLNTANLGMTDFSNLAFESVLSYSGARFGVANDGLYALDGADDEGVSVEARVRGGFINFGAEEDKNVYRAYLYVKSDNILYLKVHWDAGGDRTCQWYEITALDAQVMANRRVPLARGVRAERWSFEVQNVDGGTLELRGLEVLPAILRPRPI